MVWSFLGFFSELLISFTRRAWISISSISSFFSVRARGFTSSCAKCLTASQSSITLFPTTSCSLSDSQNCSMSKQGMRIKLSVEASSSAFTTKLFMRAISLKRQVAASLRKAREGLSCWRRCSDCRIGSSRLMMLQSLNIQMKRILLPLRKMSSQGISPCLHVLQSSSLVESFIRQLQRGMRSSSQTKFSRFSSLGSIQLCLNLLGLVKTLIFLLRMISQISYLQSLLISMSAIITFSFLQLLPFSYNCRISTFSKPYSCPYLHRYSNNFTVLAIAQAVRTSVMRLMRLSSLRRGSSLKRAFTSFILQLFSITNQLKQPVLSTRSFYLYIHFSKDMQSNRSESRSNWKQAVRKENPSESRIFGANRELPNKFSPARLATNEPTSKSLIRNRSNNYSHDEYAFAAILGESRERSNSRDNNKLEKKITIKTLPPEADEESVGKPKAMSTIEADLQKAVFKREDLDVVRELKLEFLRFKERVLKELRRQEEDLKAAIQQIYERIGSLPSCNESPVEFRASPISIKLNNITLSPKVEAHQSPISKYLDVLNRQTSNVGEADTSKKSRRDPSAMIEESCAPQIKASMNKFEELLNSLKQELNHQFPIGNSQSRAKLEID